MMRAILLTSSLLLGFCFQAAAQSPPQPTPAAAEAGELKLVVALFRHGVRAPLHQLAGSHANGLWPLPVEWGAKDWGDLTQHGADLVQWLGADYAQRYAKTLPPGFKVFLWADTDPR